VPLNYLSDDGSITDAVDLAPIGHALPDVQSISSRTAVEGELFVLALAAYRGSCWFCMSKAHHKWRLGDSSLWQELFRNSKDTKRCSSPHSLAHFERMHSLVDTFAVHRAPERDVLALYRVEDHLDGWALQFREYGLCTSSGSNNDPHPYDLNRCRDLLLRPQQTLTLSKLLSYSPFPAIWTWRKPAENGRLRWLIVPRSLGKTPPKGRQTSRYAYVENSVRIRARFSYDHTARSFSGNLTNTEIALLPGQCLRVLSLTWDGEYHTCLAEQCS